jgi:type III secretion protein C
MSARTAAQRGRQHWAVFRGLPMLALAALLVQIAAAAEIHWRTGHFTYVAQDKPLKDFIRDFAASQGLSVVIAPEVSGTINGKFNAAPQEMLDMLSMSFALTWYYDGSVLYVSPEGDLSSDVVQLGGVGTRQVQQALIRLGVADERYPLSYDRAHDTARVAGPKRYVQLVKQTLEALKQSGGALGTAEASSQPTQIRVFHLRYAWAADFTYSADGQDHTLPGLVSVLRDLYPTNRPAAGAEPSARQNKLERLRGMGYFRDEQMPSSNPERLTSVAPRQDAQSAAQSSYVPARGNLGLPQFQADGRMNAIVVRDVPEHMRFYEEVIKSLDVKPALVEIEARVLEVSEDAIDSLGVDWRARSGSASVALTPGSQSSAAATSTSSAATTGTGILGIPAIATSGLTAPLVIPGSQLPQGGVLTTVLTDSGRFLMARVTALSDHGKANIVSSPRVLTLDNVEAVLENLSTFYVPVAGNLDVGLYNISAGTSLRVTPLLVTEDGHTQIKLAVRIEDGGITQQSVGTLPVVQRTTITTQAFINEGESLLIGGYKSEVRNVTNVGIPGLSSIPVLGALFRRQQKEKTHMEHLFMLTPRIVQR